MAEENKNENAAAPASLVERLVIRKGYPTKKAIRALADKHGLIIYGTSQYNFNHEIIWHGRDTDDKAHAFNKELNNAGFETIIEFPEGYKTGKIKIIKNV